MIAYLESSDIPVDELTMFMASAKPLAFASAVLVEAKSVPAIGWLFEPVPV